MKKIIAFTFALHVAAFSNAQTPDSWTEKAAFGWSVPASSFPGPRNNAVCFSINGKGYFGTGDDAASVIYNDFWEYNPATNSWAQKANFGGGSRSGAAGFSIGNKGYAGTGTNFNTNQTDFWEYDPALNSWVQKADFTGTARTNAIGFSVGTKGYIGLGYDGAIREDIWEYNPANNTWLYRTNLPAQVRNYPAYFTLGNKCYIGTGQYYTGGPAIYFQDFWQYNPANNSWVQKANFGGTARAWATGFAIGGFGYIATGGNATGFLDEVWAYDTLANTWTQKASTGTTRIYSCSFTVGTRGYLVAGTDGWAQNDVLEYNTTLNTWTSKLNPLSSQRANGVGFSIGDKGYFGLGGDHLAERNDFWEFNASVNSWTQKANFPGAARIGVASFVLLNKGYICAGQGNSSFHDEFWMYDPALNTWTQKAAFSGGARRSASGFSIGNKGYIAAGQNAGLKKDLWEYDPVFDSWVQKADIGTNAERISATAFSIGNFGYITCGLGNAGQLKDLWKFDPDSNKWTQMADFGGVTRYHPVGFSIGNKGYAGTGLGPSANDQNDWWEYNPGSNVWIQLTSLPGQARAAAIGFSIGGKGYLGTGSTDAGFKNDFWEYTPVCTTPFATIYHSGNISSCNGDSVFLYANNSYNYQWKKNGVDITGATSYFYYAKTTGSYTCYLTNPCGTITSSAISVTVNSLPSATITPAGTTTFCSGGSVVLNVPSGVNKTYQWKKGVNLISGATLSSYSATTGGNYRVIVTNTVTGCSKTSGSATAVTVNALPAATITPQGPTTFCAGGSVVLAANTGAGLTYKWKKGSSYIAGATLSNYTATIGGNYRVQVTNSNGCSKTSALVAVSVPCKEGESVNVEEGESVFDVNVYPNPNSGEFTIRFLNKPTSPIQIELTDVIGKVVKRFETDDETIAIKESNLARGIYCLTARNNDKVVIKKINIVK